MSGSTASIQSYEPIAVLATPFNPALKSIGILGDSIAAGYKDTIDANGMLGYVEKGISLNAAFITNTRSSTTLADFVAAHSRRMAYFPQYLTSAVCELGSNDIFASGSSLAAIQALMLTTWSEFSLRGIPVWQTTITPRTTTTDAWATTANQTVVNAAQEAVRVGLNTWLRAGAPIVGGVAVAVGTTGAIVMGQAGHPLTGIFDATAQIETSFNSGIMRVDFGAPSNEGIHFLAAVTPTIATAIDVTKLR